LLKDLLLFHVGQQEGQNTDKRAVRDRRTGVGAYVRLPVGPESIGAQDRARGIMVVGAFKVGRGQGKLVQVVLASRAGRRLPYSLHRCQQKTKKNGDDGDHHQQLDQRKA
jgi:hypothetical protein